MTLGRPVRRSPQFVRNSAISSPAIRFVQRAGLSVLLHFLRSTEVVCQGRWTSVRNNSRRCRVHPPPDVLRHRHGDPSPEAARLLEIVRVTVATPAAGAKSNAIRYGNLDCLVLSA